MYHAQKLRWGLFLLSLAALLFMLWLTLYSPAALPSEGAPCLEVPVISLPGEEASKLCGRDYDDCFLFNGEKAAMDVASKTIYIPQTIGEATTRDQLNGALTLSVPNRHLYFLQDPAFDDLAQAVAQGHSFPLAVACGRHYHLYSVVFTTLPVMRLDVQNQQMHENGTPEYYGDVCLWDAETGTPVQSSLFYHARGGTTLEMNKHSWKLSLKTSESKNNHLSFLGLQKDDDWILNAMSLDDSKLKEMFLSNVWNRIVADSPWDYPMSDFRYVEVVVDGSYYGIYMLHRRMDPKYLALSEEDILMKGMGKYLTTIPQDSYEIRQTPLSENETYALMEGVYYRTDVSMLDMDNFLDISIFLQLGALSDNVGCKNMFYCLKKDGTDYKISMIPWDTDLAMGVVWIENFAYDYDISLTKTAYRREFQQMAILHPDLEDKLSQRWQQLRKDVLSTQDLLDILESQVQQLRQSGAYTRDINRWGLYYGGPDTQEAVLRYVPERLAFLDTFYE